MAGIRNTLSELFADRGVILGGTDNAVEFIHRKTLIGNRFLQGVLPLLGKTLFVRRRRRRDLAFVALLDGGDLPDSRGRGIQLFVGNWCRWRWRLQGWGLR